MDLQRRPGFRAYPNDLHHAVYGYPRPLGHEAIWIERRNRNNTEVAAHFRNRPNDDPHKRLQDGVSYEAVYYFWVRRAWARGCRRPTLGCARSSKICEGS